MKTYFCYEIEKLRFESDVDKLAAKLIAEGTYPANAIDNAIKQIIETRIYNHKRSINLED